MVNAADHKISEVEVAGLKHSVAEIPNPAESRQTRRGNARMQAITDLAMIDGL